MRTDRRTDMTKLRVTFRNFVNAPKNDVTPADILIDLNATLNTGRTETTHTKLREICSSIDEVSEKTVLSTKIKNILSVTPCSLVNRYQSFGRNVLPTF
jgi:hypothetical protein